MPHRVVVIGAGFGGIGMAISLKQAGIEDFVVVDRADDLGGTWRDNSYPGLSCDIPSHLYSFSFRPWHWSRRFPPREEILAYLHALVAEHGLGPHLRFGAGVVAAEFDERRAVWNLTVDDGGTLQAGAVGCSVGQIRRPAPPHTCRRGGVAAPPRPPPRALLRAPGGVCSTWVGGGRGGVFSNDWYPALARPNVEL